MSTFISNWYIAHIAGILNNNMGLNLTQLNFDKNIVNK